jgi:type III pantothenate kinase
MNLIIDIGNTRTKYFVFNQGEEIFSGSVDCLTPEHIALLLQEYQAADKVILSAVKSYTSELKAKLQADFKVFVELNADTPLPIENLYLSRDTLGKDRIAGVVGAFKLYPKKNILVIDAGTAITFDLITADKQYMGGNISPGLKMRFRALHQFTERLPLLAAEEMNMLYGQTTEEAIRAGVQNGIVFEVDNAINAFKEIYKNLYVIITGGDTKFFDKKLKNSFFVHYNLVAIGLNCILEHNGDI